MVDTFDRNRLTSGLSLSDEAQSIDKSILEDIVNLIQLSIFVVRPDNRVVWMNQRGRDLVNTGTELSLTNDRLRGETTTQSSEIEDMVRQTTARGAGPDAGYVVLAKSLWSRTHGRPRPIVAVGPQTVGAARRSEEQVSILFVGDQDAHSISDSRLLRDLFGFTPTEAKIAAALANGLSLTAVAQDLGIGIGTVRWHVKRAMAGSDTRRQGELIRMILLSPLGFLAIP